MHYGKRRYVHRFTVEGRGYFPLDMLRYDAAYPASAADALAAGQDARFRQVTLEHRDTDRNWKPSRERWKEFLWRPVDQQPPHAERRV